MQKLKALFSKRRIAPPSPIVEPEIQPPEPQPLAETETPPDPAPPPPPLPLAEDTAVIIEPQAEPHSIGFSGSQMGLIS